MTEGGGRRLRCYGLRLAELAAAVDALDAADRAGVAVGPALADGSVALAISGKGSALDRRHAALADALGGGALMPEDVGISEWLGRALRDGGHSVAVAESCTGGLIGHLITEAPGSSGYFRLGVVSYSNEAKSRVLGVAEATLAQRGAVSAETVVEMAEGVRELAQATLAVATSGIAGPGGGTPGKPVGTVHIALAEQGQPTRHRHRLFRGDRSEVKLQTAWAALAWLREASVERCRAGR
jgi:nicotinamide-nucleotide amidase